MGARCFQWRNSRNSDERFKRSSWQFDQLSRGGQDFPDRLRRTPIITLIFVLSGFGGWPLSSKAFFKSQPRSAALERGDHPPRSPAPHRPRSSFDMSVFSPATSHTCREAPRPLLSYSRAASGRSFSCAHGQSHGSAPVPVPHPWRFQIWPGLSAPRVLVRSEN